MMYPAALSIPGIMGIVLGVVLGVPLWSINRFLAIGVGILCITGGYVLGLWMSNRFWKSLDKGAKRKKE